MRLGATAVLMCLTGAANAFSPTTSFLSHNIHSRLYTSTTTSGTETETEFQLPDDYKQACEAALAKLTSHPSLPEDMREPLTHFIGEYFFACSQNPSSTPDGTAKNFLRAIELGTKFGMGPQHYRFGTTHKSLRGGEDDNPLQDFDFYAFGCDFFRPVMDLSKSVILGQDNLERAFRNMKQGDNIVFLANHQSEADPQVLSILAETINHAEEAAEIYYVAGHKVTTDPLAIPFSMGRNLICIHSKKHIFADPETQPIKQRQNLAAMASMVDMMKRGSCALWVAPSGGRDRRDPDSDYVPIDNFDQKTIDMFRLMGNKSKVKTHFYPLAMASYDLCPPPDYIESGVGEKRNVRYVSVGIACGKEVENVGGVESRHLFTEHAEEECKEYYDKLLQAMKEKEPERVAE